MTSYTIPIIEYRDKALQQLQTVSELTERAQSLAEEDKNGADAVCLLLARQTRQSVNNAIGAIHKMLHFAAVANNNGEDLGLFLEQNQEKKPQ